MAPKEATEVEISKLAERKLQMMAQIHELRSEIRKVDLELVRVGGAHALAQQIIRAW
jgi:hypothetical protein